MDSSRIIELMAKKLGKSASVEELKELELLTAANPSYGWLEEIVGSLKGSPEHFERNIPVEELAGGGWQRLAGRLNGEEPAVTRIGKRVWMRRLVAAVVVLIAGAGVLWYFQGDRNPFRVRYAEKTTKVEYGERSKLILSDGTVVWLNAGSRLDYPEVFAGARREVTLEGEAFFEVAQHVSMPFFVHAGKITVRVLGTSFDVKAYREDAEVSTTLISGKVQVSMDDEPDKKIILTPHEKVTVMDKPTQRAAAGTGTGLVRSVIRYQVQVVPVVAKDSLEETAWVENKLVVSNESFGEVAKMLERRYRVEIEFDGERLRQAHLSGVFEKETIEQVLDILKATTKFKYSIVGKKVRLMPDL